MRRPSPKSAAQRLVERARRESSALRQGFVALLIGSFGSLVAGLTLGAITDDLEKLPGLLVLIPAANGMRGNVFGALGNRLGTGIHAGWFHLSRRLDTPVGQNLAASYLLSISVSLGLAFIAKGLAIAFAVHNTIGIADFVVVSVVGGVLSSTVVMGVTVGVASVCARRGWDLDNVAAPLVTAAGDLVTLPSLFLASFLVRIDLVTPVVAGACTLAGVVAGVYGVRARLDLLRRIVRESMPVLTVAAVVSIVAGVTIEKRLDTFTALPALLVLIPPFLAQAGSLGGILSARFSTKLHLGFVDARRLRLSAVADDVLLIYVFAVFAFLQVGIAADVVAALMGLESPGVLKMLGVSFIAGMLATTAAVGVALGTSVLAYRAGLDPDNHAIPMVTSSLDLLGAGAVILVLVLLNVT